MGRSVSIKILTEVWQNGPAGQGELLVMLALADWCNDAGECWPSMDGIAEKARLSDARSARRIVRRLEADGWIEIDTGGGRHGCNKYVLKLGPKVLSKPGPKVPRTESPPDPERKKPGLSMPKTRTLEPAEPLITINEPSVSAREALLGVLSEDAADAFIEHRKAMKKPLTALAARMVAKKLDGHPNPDAVVEDSIANGWQGIFPERSKHDKPSREEIRLRAFIAGAAGET